MTQVLGKSVVGTPGVGVTQTFITVGAFDAREEDVLREISHVVYYLESEKPKMEDES